MAGSLSNFTELEILDHLFGGAAYSAPATLYLGLFTATPSDAGGGTEVSGGSYARKAVTANATNFPAASAGAITLNVAQSFVTATASWGVVTQFGIFDAVSVGNLIAWGDLTASKTVDNGDTVSFAVGSLVIQLD